MPAARTGNLTCSEHRSLLTQAGRQAVVQLAVLSLSLSENYVPCVRAHELLLGRLVRPVVDSLICYLTG